jgi:alkylation response protein AidB-like acyl-CoA dehydrogenase
MSMPRELFTEDHQAFRESVRTFLDKEIAPHHEAWEQDGVVSREAWRAAGRQGLLGYFVDEAYGGGGVDDYRYGVVIAEELSRGGFSGPAFPLHNDIIGPYLHRLATQEQRDRWLRGFCSGELITAIAMTEPGIGSDLASMATSAIRDGDRYVVNGSKTFITNGVRADFVVTAVKTTPEGGHHGISFLLLEKGMEGFTVSRKLEKLGWRASDTAELAFQDVFVPEENLLGEENKGFYLIMANFQWERLAMALGAVGAMGAVLERTIGYAQEREAFGRPIAKHQVIRHKIAEMALKHEASKAITYNSLRLFHEGHDAIREVTMAKLLSQRAAFDNADEAIQIHGGAGYMVEYDVERAAHDARLGPIGGGTDEIMREILSKLMGL